MTRVSRNPLYDVLISPSESAPLAFQEVAAACVALVAHRLPTQARSCVVLTPRAACCFGSVNRSSLVVPAAAAVFCAVYSVNSGTAGGTGILHSHVVTDSQ